MLGDFGDLDNGLVLAVAANLADPLLSLVTDSSDLLGLDIGLQNFGSNFGLVDKRRADLDTVTVNHQQRFEAKAPFAGLFDELDFDDFAFADYILFAAGGDNCFFHNVHKSIPKIPAPVKDWPGLIYLSFGEFDCQFGVVDFNFGGKTIIIDSCLLG